MTKRSKTETLQVRSEEMPEDDAPDRKMRIIRSAEMLIAQHGYHAINIREIAEHAGVPLGLVRYYYGAKAEMFHAIFKRWSHVNEERLALLDEVMKDTTQPDLLRRILEAFILPVLALQKTEEGANYVTLVSRELMHPIEEAQLAIKEFFDPVALAFLAAMQQAFPQATRDQVGWGYQFTLGALLSFLFRNRVSRLLDASGDAELDNDPKMLLDTIIGGLNAALEPASRGRSAQTKKVSS